MDTISRSRQAIEPRSGGKIVRARRTAAARTPYDRPRRHNPPPENPNWLSRLIFSPTRMITSGAGKLMSSVFSADSSSGSSSSSSSSSSSGDSDSEDNTDDNCNNKEISTQGTINCFQKDAQPTVEKSETKRLIEQLVMQETFTREEYIKLTKIIEARVVDYCTTEDVENQRLIETPKKTIGDNAILCSTAVMEARKWLTQKKLGSASKSDINHVTEDEGSSPVDMAKLYMKARPLWASPSFKQEELKSPSSINAQLFVEETPGSLGGNVVSSSKLKKDTPSIGSWNIQEEIQRVRSKATEEMLRTLPSKRIDWSGLGLENEGSPNAFMSGDREANMGNKMHNSLESINASLATGKSTSHGFKVLEMTQDGLQIEASSPDQIHTDPEQNQDLEAIQTKTVDGKVSDDCLVDTLNTQQTVKLSQDAKNLPLSDAAAAAGVHGHKDTSADDKHLSHMVEGNLEEPRSQEENCSTSKEAAGTRSHYKTNGFPPPSLSAEGFTEQNVILEDEGHNAVSSSFDKIVTDVFVDQTCEILSETSMEIPNNVNDSMNENDSAVDGSQGSLGIYNESSPSQTRSSSKRRPAANTGVEIQQRGKRLTRYNRRGRGRDK
ncbi:protein KAKU4 isoform X1 [Ziziphus jujuba]|uniref:Protein KAKU4 isoform X1 n=1 Tax=Ziziphus jujuba TaxID=326968 RepID=A0A6P3ZYK6_ZIZJJ|nr:protein KAKU4 isoform X1 [Ziziphus jujuba]